MKVLVDARSLGSGRGVARYTRRTLAAAVAAHPGTGWHALVPADGPADAELPAGVLVHRTRLASRPHFGLGAMTGRPRLDLAAADPDVVWLPSIAPVGRSRATPVVLTVHDLSFLQRPQDFTPYERAWHHVARVGRLVTGAAAVTCVTQAVAADVAARWPQASSRLHVVAPGVDRPPAGAPVLPPWVPARYLLWVGALEPRKAPGVLAAAFVAARRAGLDADLVVVGAGRLAGVLDGPGIHHLDRADDATLHALYAGALALVMPSALEGFGLPPLEAALHGTPSVLTDLPAFRETLGDAAAYVPPGDAPALAAALTEVAADAGLRSRLGAAARAAAAPMTWERSAARLHAVLEGAAR